MPRKTAADFDPEVLILFDAYVHGALDRRGFLDKAAKYAVSGVTAAMLLDELSPKFAEAQQVSRDDARLKTEYAQYASPQGSGTMKGYLARAASGGSARPGVLVIHENRGLNPHIEDIARRIALDGYVAFAPDALTPLGGYPAAGEDEARALFGKLDQAKTREDMVAAAAFLRTHKECNGRIGVVGFCYGGGVCNLLATRVPELRAAAPFYGGPPPIEDVPKIKAQLVLHYAGNDQRVNASWPAYETALKAAGVKYDMHLYPGVEHGFNNDTTPRYDKAAATLAWTRTMELFAATLKS
ncbi:MAG: dienelactone hydrolase family protein [Vicinamibacterales bacterium]